MIIKIKDMLKDNEDKLYEILTDIGCHNIHKSSQNQFRFGLDDEGSGSGNSLLIDTLKYKSFSRDISGDIITLVSRMKNIELNESIRWLGNKLNIANTYFERKPITLPFNGFFKKYSKIQHTENYILKTYDRKKLFKYIQYGTSLLFIQDGISAIVQEEFNIGYDIASNRIAIPWIDENGDLVGIMGRKNKIELYEKECKYLPIIDFTKSFVLYGLYQNYKNILNSNYMIICESEKSVLKGREIGLNNVISLGGNNISPRQASLIKSMCCDVIIALDEGISLEHCKEEAEKVKINNPFFANNVYIVDMDMTKNNYIKEKKLALLDLDKNTIEKILKSHLIKY
ncbi:TPA: hypothetical protein PTV74_003213 [Clostridium botulinum]|nr:hypothetical protein [Clostridium botulinum]HDK7206368.1 hypothetical protein [Clostridium botulinum]HDK7210104.1 hypothetical protein [Clostridium botulinum]HDK7265553.1 hypothetical protein [Clostridium botulinum]HDK7269401.1 hypothetical protein [Clostridium botulinum]